MYKPITLNSKEHRIFFTSDLHFGHRNIIEYCKRPWNTVEEMDEGLIDNWNSIVGKDDIVFDLGDFAFASPQRWKELIASLNGHHHLILGNHEIIRYPGKETLALFESVNYQLLLNIDGRYVYLNHYPFLCYGGSWKSPKNAVWQLFGHTHSRPNDSGHDKDRLANLFPYQYDVGVDNNNYKPISWESINDIINKQVWSKQTIEKA